YFFFSSRRRHTIFSRDWSSDGALPICVPDQNLQELLQLPIEDWKTHIHNDFEYALFERYPEIAQLKNDLYELGAIYASMTGSGSSVYGIFKNAPNFDNKFKNCFVWQGELS